MNRFYNQFRLALEKSVTELYFSATIGSSGAPTIVTAASKGIASIARNSAGKYTVTLSNRYVGFLTADVKILKSDGLPASPSFALITVGVNSATPTIVFQLSAAGVATDPDSGTTLYGSMQLKSSTAY